MMPLVTQWLDCWRVRVWLAGMVFVCLGLFGLFCLVFFLSAPRVPRAATRLRVYRALSILPAMWHIGQFVCSRNFFQMKIYVQISGDLTVNFGPNSIKMFNSIQTLEPHVGIDKMSILS